MIHQYIFITTSNDKMIAIIMIMDRWWKNNLRKKGNCRLTHLLGCLLAVNQVFRVVSRSWESFHHRPSKTQFFSLACTVPWWLSPRVFLWQHQICCAAPWSSLDHSSEVSEFFEQTSMTIKRPELSMGGWSIIKLTK